MTSSTKSGMARSTFSMPCSSFRQGMMTVMVWPLYMGRLYASARVLAIIGSMVMKRLGVPFLCCAATLACAADLAQTCIRCTCPTMSGGLDQYLANRLTDEHVFAVVTDPKLADAVFTDQIGAELRDASWKTQLPSRRNRRRSRSQSHSQKAGTSRRGRSHSRCSAIAVEQAVESRPAHSTFGRGKGTVFLVDAKSRAVIWSAYRASQERNFEGTGPHGLRHCKPHRRNLKGKSVRISARLPNPDCTKSRQAKARSTIPQRHSAFSRTTSR